jgi:ribosome-binding factor A
MSFRIEKINELIKQKLGQIISQEMEFPQNCLVTISRVQTSPDLKYCQVFITVLPEKFRGSVLEILNKNRHNLYRELKAYLKTKFTPNLKFALDQQEIFASEVDKLLDEINKQ